MKKQEKKALFRIAASAGLLAAGNSYAIGTTFDVITPGEYALPVDFKPFNIFVQYATLESERKDWDMNGNRVAGSDDQTLVGLSKYVRLFTMPSHPDIGLAWEVILPEVGVRNATDHTHDSGFGDPLTGFAIWKKPTANLDIGLQSFLNVPVGDTSVGAGETWQDLTSLFWTYKFGPNTRGDWTGDAGIVYSGRNAATGETPGLAYHTNERVGWMFGKVFEPFVGVDYQYDSSASSAPKGYEFNGDIGLQLHYFSNQSLSLKWTQGIKGENYPVTNTFSLKYVYVW